MNDDQGRQDANTPDLVTDLAVGLVVEEPLASVLRGTVAPEDALRSLILGPMRFSSSSTLIAVPHRLPEVHAVVALKFTPALDAGSSSKFSGAGPPPPAITSIETTLSAVAAASSKNPVTPAVLVEDVVTERSRRWRESNSAYESELERERITVRHRRECVRVARKAGELLAAAGLSCDPRFFGDAQLNHLLEGPWRGGKAYEWCLLNRFLKRSDNLIIERARLRFDRTPKRPKLALTHEERVKLLDSARRAGIVPYAMIVLMLTMGLRPSEVRRLTVQQATSDPLVFVGKRKGIEQGFGKVRRVPPHPLFRELLPELLAHREQVVAGWTGKDAGFLFCHLWQGELGPWGKAWFERHFIVPVFEDAGVHAPFNLSYRARRTFGRVARLEQKHPIEKVARLMGHSDPRTTVQYLGLNEDDDRAVIDSTRDSYGTPLTATAEQRKGGRIGHAG